MNSDYSTRTPEIRILYRKSLGIIDFKISNNASISSFFGFENFKLLFFNIFTYVFETMKIQTKNYLMYQCLLVKLYFRTPYRFKGKEYESETFRI